MNSTFPAVYSTLSPAALASLIAEKYGSTIVECTLLVRGVGDTYLARCADANYILRVYRSSHRDPEQIEAETELLIALKTAGVSVSYPIADLRGEVIQRLHAIEGTRYAVLFSYAPGQPLNSFNDAQLTALGTEMAKFHNVSSCISLKGGRWNFDIETTLTRPLEMLQRYFAEDPEGYTWFLLAAQRVREYFSAIDTSTFSTGYCHFDFLPKNFHFDDDGGVTFFDFDFFGRGWLVNDVMTFWQHLCLDVHFGKITQQEADRSYSIFIDAYKTCRPLHKEELDAVRFLSLGFWLFYMGFHTTHDQFLPYVQPANLKLRTNMIRQLMERYWQ